MHIQSASATAKKSDPVPKEQVAGEAHETQLDEQRLEQVFIGSIDQGTTSTRFIIFNGIGEVSRLAYSTALAALT
jgi:glycerol kinase